MAGTHTQIGTDVGNLARFDDMLETVLDGGAAATIDGLDRFEDEVRTNWLGADVDRNTVGVAAIAEIRNLRSFINQARSRWIRQVVNVYGFNILRPDIASPATALDDLFFDLSEEMRDDSEAVEENSVTLGSITADVDNVGDGNLFVYIDNPIDKRDEERINTADFLAQCIRDVRQDQVTPGAEVLEVQSSRLGKLGRVTVGFNEGVTGNRLDNGTFDDFAVTDTPDSWNIDNGAVTTHITEETGTVFRTGGSALRFDGDGAQATISISQDEVATATNPMIGTDTSPLRPQDVMLLSLQLQTSAAMSGTLTIGFTGTGYVAGTGEQIIVTAPVATFAEQTAIIVLPKDIPSDFAIDITWSGTPAGTDHVIIDDMVLQSFQTGTPFNRAGIRVAATRGASDFIRGPTQADKFNWSITNAFTGIFQTFFTRLTDRLDPDSNKYPDIGRAMPSAAAATANYAETKAQ